MRRCLLDTGIASDYVNKRYGVFDRAKAETAKGNPIGIGMPVLAELVYGIERSASRDRNMRLLQASLSALRLWPFDRPAAFEFGRLRTSTWNRPANASHRRDDRCHCPVDGELHCRVQGR